MNLGDLEIMSPAFGFDARVPTRHAGDGEDVSPAIEWRNVPDGTRELVLIVHDPDAPLIDGFTHWVVYGIPASESGIDEGGGGRFTEGINDFGNKGYGGPAPPQGHGTHHYFFHLYALDAELELDPGVSRRELLERIEPHVLEQARLVGTYSR